MHRKSLTFFKTFPKANIKTRNFLNNFLLLRNRKWQQRPCGKRWKAILKDGDNPNRKTWNALVDNTIFLFSLILCTQNVTKAIVFYSRKTRKTNTTVYHHNFFLFRCELWKKKHLLEEVFFCCCCCWGCWGSALLIRLKIFTIK